MRVESLHRHLPQPDGRPDDPIAQALAEWLVL